MKWLNRADAAAYITEHYFPCAKATLARYAGSKECVGKGPLFRKAGARTVVYDPADLDTWAKAILETGDRHAVDTPGRVSTYEGG